MTYQGGHEVTFLHEEASEAQINLLWELVRAAGKHIPSWDTESERLTMRCLEAIDYFEQVDGSPDDRSEIGWHDDGATLYTMVRAYLQ